jgi:hypothetical protein
MEGGVRSLLTKALLLAILILGLSISPAWAGGWLSTGDIPFDVRDIAVDGEGNVIAVGESDFEDSGLVVVQVATRAPDGTWSAPKTISNEVYGLDSIKIAANDKGHVIVVWRVLKEEKDEDEDIQAAARTPDGEWVGPEEVAPSAPDREVEVALNEQGAATVTSVDLSDTLVSRTRSADGAWSQQSTNISSGEGEVESHRLAANEAGHLVAAWDEFEGDDHHVRVREFRPGQGWGPVSTISIEISSTNHTLRAALDEQGGAGVVWRNFSTKEIIASVKPPNGSWSQPDVVGSGRLPQVDFDSQGTVTVVWEGIDQAEIRARSKPRSGSWRTPAILASANTDEGEGVWRPWLGINQDGLAVAFWLHKVPGEVEFAAARLPMGGSWLPAGEFALEPGTDEIVVAALDPNGSIAVAWENPSTNEAPRSSDTAILDWAPPRILKSVVPGTAMPNRITKFSIEAQDSSGPVTTQWTFPGGRVVNGASAEHTFTITGTFKVSVAATDALGNVAELSRDVKVAEPATPGTHGKSDDCQRLQKRIKTMRAKARRSKAKIKRLNRQIRGAKSPVRKRKLRVKRKKAHKILKKQKKALKVTSANGKGFCRVGK